MGRKASGRWKGRVVAGVLLLALLAGSLPALVEAQDAAGADRS